MNPGGSAATKLRILGAGVSGQAAARLALEQGLPAEIFDERSGSGTGPVAGSCDPNVLTVVSPGFPIEHPWCHAVREAGGVLIPELEFGASALTGELLMVTGSLGKTSMVLLLADLLRAAGYDVTVSGNIGTPVSETACQHPEADLHLIEASSFQLETLHSLRVHRAVCLNLFPNHLDRHGELETYAQAKARMFRYQQPEDLAVWPEVYPVPVRTAARRILPQPEAVPTLEGTPFARGPLRQNLMMALAACEGLRGLEPERIEQGVRAFRFPDHRMQEVDLPGAGRVINDSKSTCLAATAAALNSVPGRVHLFMGGQGKQEDLSEMTPLLQARNPVLYLFGASAKKMQSVWQDSVDVCVRADSLDELMKPLLQHRKSLQEAVLFSPGCASFDQFDGFAARGEAFVSCLKDAVASS